MLSAAIFFSRFGIDRSAGKPITANLLGFSPGCGFPIAERGGIDI